MAHASLKYGIVAAAAALALPGAANAAQPVITIEASPETPCLSSNITPNALNCSGWYSGNLNGGSTAQDNASIDALNVLLGAGTYTTSNFGFLEGANVAGTTITFGQAVYGLTVFSIHVGGSSGPDSVGYQSTAFFQFDAGNTGITGVTFNLNGLSNYRLYSTSDRITNPPPPAVPEPATWMMMLFGFGLVGASLRYSKGTAFRKQFA